MILDRLFRPQASTLKSPSPELLDGLGVRPTNSGQVVTPDSSLRESAVFSCVNLLSKTIATLPFGLYRKLGDGNREQATDHPLFEILHHQFNEDMTSIDFRIAMMFSLLLRGNSYNEIERDRAGRVRNIWPINPDSVHVGRSKKTKKLTFEIHDGDVRVIPNHKMWRVISGSTNGLIGLSAIGCANETIGLSLSLQEHAARMFSAGAKPGGILEHPGELTKSAIDNLTKSWNKAYQGVKNSHKVAVLAEGMKWSQIGLNSVDAQFIESRKYQRSEIAGIFGVPPHMIGDLDKATFSNIEHQSIQFVVYSLLPWLKSIEQAVRRDLLSTEEKEIYFAEHNVQGMLRGDSKSRSEIYKVLFMNGVLTPNDIARFENINSFPDGDEHYLQSQMATIGRINSGELGANVSNKPGDSNDGK